MADFETPLDGRYRPVTLDGRTLTWPSLRQITSGASLLVDEPARLRAIDGQQTAERIAGVRPLYGRNTGVGANRDQATTDDAPTDHGLAILRSHAAGWGDCLTPRNIRCALTIRANQLLAGDSGADVELALALADLVDGPKNDLPQVHRYGALGTSGLTALAEVGMALLGERPRAKRRAPTESPGAFCRRPALDVQPRLHTRRGSAGLP